MKKNTYLDDPHVRSFVEWMGQHLRAGSRLGHGYARPGLPPLQFANLAAALEQYEWDFSFRRIDGRRCAGRSFADNAAVLDDLQQRLRRAVFDGIPADVRDAAIEVMRWGGVAPRNEAWLRSNESELAAGLARVSAALEQNDDALELGPDLRFNAGMTKVYSLLLDHFVIYDSRVAAALAWFVAIWAGERVIPDTLRFPCMVAKEDPKATRRKLRNPRPGREGFPLLGHRPYTHAKWNLRASWILRALLETNPDTAFGAGTAGSRRLEAALFMWGYDLTPPAPAAAGVDPLALRAA
jgi:hypothetical protein